MSGSKPLLAVLKGEMRTRPPVWLMRQAGRYLPEYRALRAEKGGFLALATDPQAAAEVTVQPIRRFGFDGAILFSDILMVPWALGQDLTFGVGEGPRLAPALVDVVVNFSLGADSCAAAGVDTIVHAVSPAGYQNWGTLVLPMIDNSIAAARAADARLMMMQGTRFAFADEAERLFTALDWLEERLATRRYLVGDAITESDVRLFTTLARFDAVYHGHFKCNRRKLTEMPNLWGYARDLFTTPGFGDTIDFTQIKQHYYLVHRDLNPKGIIPDGPDLSVWAEPHDRARLGGTPFGDGTAPGAIPEAERVPTSANPLVGTDGLVR